MEEQLMIPQVIESNEDIPQNNASLVPNKAVKLDKNGRFRLEDNEFIADKVCMMKVGKVPTKDIIKYTRENWGVDIPIGTINAIERSKIWARRCAYHRRHLSVQINNIPNAHPIARMRALDDIISRDDIDDKVRILAIHEMELQTQSDRMQKMIFDTDDTDSMSHEEKVRIIIPRFIKMVEDVRLPEYLSVELKKALIQCAERIKKYDKFVENKINMNVEVNGDPTKNSNNYVPASSGGVAPGGVSA